MINPFLAEIAPLDTVATAADPDGAGPLISGYDEDFKEVVKLPDGSSARVEKTHIIVPCQVENDMSFEMMRQIGTGDAPDTLMRLVFHYQYLEDNSLVDAVTGEPLIRKNDRLVAIRDYNTNDIIESFKYPPGLFIVEVRSASFGLCSQKRNLLIATLHDREQGQVRGAL